MILQKGVAVEALQIARDLITSVVAIVGGSVAVLGYRAWHRQILGKTQHDVARTVLLAALRVREEIRNVRRPHIFAVSDDKELSTIGPVRVYLKHIFQMYSARLDRLGKQVVEFELAALEAEALWGGDTKHPIAGLKERVRKLQTAIWKRLLHDQAEAGQVENVKLTPDVEILISNLAGQLEGGVKMSADQVRENLHIISSSDASSTKGQQSTDSFGDSVDSALSEIERYYRPRLQLKGR
jgi:hypothetical protein